MHFCRWKWDCKKRRWVPRLRRTCSCTFTLCFYCATSWERCLSVWPSVHLSVCQTSGLWQNESGWTLLVTIISLLLVCFYNIPANKMQLASNKFAFTLCFLCLLRVCFYFLECSCVFLFFCNEMSLAVLCVMYDMQQTAITNIHRTDTSQNTDI